MQAIYYYPTKLSITQDTPEQDDAEETPDLDELFDARWRQRGRRLQARRWEKVHLIEQSQRDRKRKRLDKIRQKRWLQRHGWPRVSQPMV